MLTFHRCINYGSYWQARALAEGLRGLGHDAVILDHRSSQVTRAEWKNAFQPVRPARTARGDYPEYRIKTRKFLQAFERLPLSRPFDLEDPAGMDAFDLVVVGSDEVWNFQHPWYAARPLFFGDGVKADRLVAYAASFGCHDASAALDEAWAQRLRRFEAIAVRDENSRALVEAGLGEAPPLVLDPCLQFAERVRRPAATDSDEVVVYGHSFSERFAARVRDWAWRRGLRLVSVGYRNDWADEQRLSAGPDEFADAVGAAQAVVTNFFHGCVFALANARPFVCTPTQYRWHKISALMQAAQAEDRFLDEAAPQAAFDQALDTPPDGATRARLAALKAQSAEFLDHALG